MLAFCDEADFAFKVSITRQAIDEEFTADVATSLTICQHFEECRDATIRRALHTISEFEFGGSSDSDISE